MADEADCSIARHGWGITPDPSLAITYLSQAAANAADIEAQALGAGMKKGGAAKGELVLAIYELVRSRCSSAWKSARGAALVPADRCMVSGELLSTWLGRGKGSYGIPDVSRGGGESERH